MSVWNIAHEHFFRNFFFQTFSGCFCRRIDFFWLKFRFFVYNTKIGILAKKIDPSTKTSRKSLENKNSQKMLLCNVSYRQFNQVSLFEMLWSDLQNDISSVWHIFAQIYRKSEFLEPNQKSRFWPKNRSFAKSVPKKFRRKKSSRKMLLSNFSYG